MRFEPERQIAKWKTYSGHPLGPETFVPIEFEIDGRKIEAMFVGASCSSMLALHTMPFLDSRRVVYVREVECSWP